VSGRTKPPFRADRGQPPPPGGAPGCGGDFAADRIGAGKLRRIEDESIRDAVRMQEEIDLTEDEQWAKPRLVADVAREVWG